MDHKSENLIKDNDFLYKNLYTWLANQYDLRYGGFYYAASSKLPEEFKPDIESTAQAINILKRSQLIKQMPEKMKQQIIAFFQNRQTEAGYFYDPHNHMNEVERMVGRAINYSIHSIQILGGKAFYPLPGERGINSAPSYLHSLTSYKKWLDLRPWDYAWMACDNIQAGSIYIRALPQSEKQKYFSFLLDYLFKGQDPETGMWGKGRPYIRLSGAFKLSGVYRSVGQAMPRAEKIYQFILDTIRNDISEDICWTRNTMDLLIAIKPNIKKPAKAEIEEILKITYKNLRQYLKPDGGFSRHRDASLKIPNNVPLGLGLPEGDMNASTQALRIRSLCHNFIELKEQPFVEFCKDFYKTVLY